MKRITWGAISLSLLLLIGFQNCSDKNLSSIVGGVRASGSSNNNEEPESSQTPSPTPSANPAPSVTPTPAPTAEPTPTGTPPPTSACWEPTYTIGTSFTEQLFNGQKINVCDLVEARYCINGKMNSSSDSSKFIYPPQQNLCYLILPPASTSTATCTLDGRVLKHGEISIFYRKKVVGETENCLGQSRSCNNGVLSGSNDYASASCGHSHYIVPQPPSPCTFNGSSITEGSITIGYRDAQAKTCSYSIRRCLKGQLDQPDYQYSSCKFVQ